MKVPGPTKSIHTKQNWSRFGSRSGAIPKYLIQHRGGLFFGSGSGTKIMAPPGAKSFALWQMVQYGSPTTVWSYIEKNGAPSTDLYSSLVVCVCRFLLGPTMHRLSPLITHFFRLEF